MKIWIVNLLLFIMAAYGAILLIGRNLIKKHIKEQ